MWGFSWVYPNSRQLSPEAMVMGIETAGRGAIWPSWVGRSTGHILTPGECHLGMATLHSRYLCSGQDKGRCSWWHWAHRSPHSRSCAPCRGRWWCGSSGPQSPRGTGTCHRAGTVSRRKMKQNIMGWLPQNDQHRTLAKSWVWCPPVKHWAQGWVAAQPARGCCVATTTG